MEKTDKFLRTSLLYAALSAVLCLFILHLVANSMRSQWPERPFLPMPGKVFVGNYDRNSGQNVSYIYRRRLFGFEKKIKECDLLILGSSHTLYGLSARELEKQLSKHASRPIKVFNASIAGGTFADALEILRANHVQDKAVLIDLFYPGQDHADQNPASTDFFGANIKVLSSWCDYGKDWLLDPLLPQVTIGTKHVFPHFQRALGLVAYQDWTTGDATQLWSPRYNDGQGGVIFPQAATGTAFPIKNASTSGEPFIKSADIPEAFRNEAEKNHLQVIVTLVPYSNDNPEEAAAIASRYGYPFIFISDNGLSTWDNASHLTGESRQIATERLFKGMFLQGIEISSH